MGTWNYRIVRHPDCLGLHEAFYNSSGQLCGWTQDPIIVGDDIDELRRVLQKMSEDLERSKDDPIPHDRVLAYGNEAT